MIAFDTESSGGGSSSPITWAHTITGANPILVVGVALASGSDLVTGVTYNGIAMTRLTTTTFGGGTRRTYLYYLINPSTGANTVSVALSSGATCQAVSVSYAGVQQSGQPDASTTHLDTSVTTSTVSLTTISDNCWMISYCHCRLVGVPNAGTGTTNRGSSGSDGMGDSNGVIHPAGSYSMTWTQSGSEDFNVIQLSISPAPITTTSTTTTTTTSTTTTSTSTSTSSSTTTTSTSTTTTTSTTTVSTSTTRTTSSTSTTTTSTSTTTTSTSTTNTTTSTSSSSSSSTSTTTTWLYTAEIPTATTTPTGNIQESTESAELNFTIERKTEQV